MHTGIHSRKNITAENIMEKTQQIPLHTAPPRFTVGRIVWARGVNDLIAENIGFAKLVITSLKRHARGDWGDLCNEDKTLNDHSINSSLRIFSAYDVSIGGVDEERIWIITEADRSATTVLFPHEY
jgi:hypothetical protein